VKKKWRNIIRDSAPPVLFLALTLALWQGISASGMVTGYMLPSPMSVARAFTGEFPLLMGHLGVTLWEAMLGLAIAVVIALALAILMDASRFMKRSLTPALLLTQTVPTIAIAPLLVLWLGSGAAPKIVLVFLTCFFPMTIGLLGGLAQVDEDAIRLLRSMGARRAQIYRYGKLPSALPAFFSSLKISASYAIVGAVVSEWLGGDAGLGFYMIRVRRSYSFDKMFAVILLTAALSLVLVKLVSLLERWAMPWRGNDKEL